MKKPFLILVILCLAGALVFSAAGCNDILSIFAVSDAPGDYTLSDVHESLGLTKTFAADIFYTISVIGNNQTINYSSGINYTLCKVEDKTVIYSYLISAYPDGVIYIADGAYLTIEEEKVKPSTLTAPGTELLIVEATLPTGTVTDTASNSVIVAANKAYANSYIASLYNQVQKYTLDFSGFDFSHYTSTPGVAPDADSLAFVVNTDDDINDALVAVLRIYDFFSEVTGSTLTISADNETHLPIQLDIGLTGTKTIQFSSDEEYVYTVSIVVRVLFKNFDKEDPIVFPAELTEYLKDEAE